VNENESTTAAAGLRKILHLRYVRAFIAGVSFAMIVCSVAACVIQIRHEVSLGAVCRYFSRPFYGEANLEADIRSHLTTAQLEALFSNDSAINRGGFVYREDGVLRFYPHATESAKTTRSDQAQNESLFPRLIGHYRDGDISGLAQAFSAPAVRARLVREGVPGAQIDLLCKKVSLASGEVARIRALRSFLPHVAQFAPYEGKQYELTFREKLRFYERNQPEGEFVGTFEVLGLQLDPSTDDEFGRSMAERNHYLAILRLPGGRILVKDYFEGRLRTYTIRRLEHPADLPLFKVA